MKQYQSTKKSKIETSRQITSSASKRVDSNYMISEMKQLLKENTALKQENLMLKQQIMLSKIQIQNLQLKLEQALTTNRQALILKMAKIQEAKDVPKKQIGRHIKLRSELVKQTYVQNEPKQKRQSSIKMLKQQVLNQISQYSTVSNTTNITEKSLFQDKKIQSLSSRSTTLKKDEQPEINSKKIRNERQGKSVSRKQQIMDKYRPFLDINNSILAQKIDLIKSNR